MAKTNLILITSFLFLLFTFGCQGQNEGNKMIVKCLIYPTGIASETYLIKVFEDGKLDITFGNKSNSYEKEDFNSIVNKGSTILKGTDFKIITDLQSQILNLKEVEKTNTKKGGWEVIILTGQKKYHFYYGEQNESPLGQLIEVLKQVSPFKIDMHSWS